jgi:hypothetical protein
MMYGQATEVGPDGIFHLGHKFVLIPGNSEFRPPTLEDAGLPKSA